MPFLVLGNSTIGTLLEYVRGNDVSSYMAVNLFDSCNNQVGFIVGICDVHIVSAIYVRCLMDLEQIFL